MFILSQNFTLQEFEQSDKAKELNINNAIESQEIKDAIKSLVDSVLRPLRDAWGKPLAINSGYRCKENTRTLLVDVNAYKVRDSLNAAKAQDLSLKLSELKKYRQEDAKLIADMGVKLRNLQAVANMGTETRTKETRHLVSFSLTFLKKLFVVPK